jgi:hypothetical protein
MLSAGHIISAMNEQTPAMRDGMAKKMYTHHIETIRPEDLPIMLAKHGNLGNRLASVLERPDGTFLLIFEYEIELG